MERRTFLQLVAGGAVAGAIGGLASAQPHPMLTWDDNAPLFPGLPLLVGLRDDARGACHVTIVMRHGAAVHVAPVCTLAPGEERRVELPYPYDQLIAGNYDVELVAMTTDGRWQDQQRVGTLTVSALRFGA